MLVRWSRTAAISSVIAGFPGEVVPVLGNVQTSVLNPSACRRSHTGVKTLGPSQKPGTKRMVGAIWLNGNRTVGEITVVKLWVIERGSCG